MVVYPSREKCENWFQMPHILQSENINSNRHIGIYHFSYLQTQKFKKKYLKRQIINLIARLNWVKYFFRNFVMNKMFSASKICGFSTDLRGGIDIFLSICLSSFTVSACTILFTLLLIIYLTLELMTVNNST